MAHCLAFKLSSFCRQLLSGHHFQTSLPKLLGQSNPNCMYWHHELLNESLFGMLGSRNQDGQHPQNFPSGLKKSKLPCGWVCSIGTEMSPVMRSRLFAYVKTKMQISFTVTAKLISAFVFYTDSTIPLLSESEISSL